MDSTDARDQIPVDCASLTSGSAYGCPQRWPFRPHIWCAACLVQLRQESLLEIGGLKEDE